MNSSLICHVVITSSGDRGSPSPLNASTNIHHHTSERTQVVFLPGNLWSGSALGAATIGGESVPRRALSRRHTALLYSRLVRATPTRSLPKHPSPWCRMSPLHLHLLCTLDALCLLLHHPAPSSSSDIRPYCVVATMAHTSTCKPSRVMSIVLTTSRLKSKANKQQCIRFSR